MRAFFLNTFLCCIFGAIPLVFFGQNAPNADPVLRIPNPQFGNFIPNPTNGNAAHAHNGQTNYFECGFDQMRARLAHTHPQREQAQNELELNYQRHLRSLHQQAQPRTVLTVPVVFHIIHNNGISNISNARVNTALQYLNDAFANRGTFQSPNGTDIEIQFCLAQRTPNNTFSNGVNRVVSPLTVMDKDNDDAALKNLIRWNPTQYINVWVVDEIIGGTAGYAYFPSSHGNNEDGVVIEDDWVGVSQATSMVLTHEMGHYFGLYHTFEAGCPNADCTANGDKVCDTNPDNTTARPPCNTPGNSCTTDADDLSANNPFRPIANGGQGDQPDQIQNYMDYSDFVCYDRFTAGQKTRMRFFLNGARASLLSSNGCAPACGSPISLNIVNDSLVVNQGNLFTISRNVAGATIYRWYVDGVLTFSTANPTFNLPNIGRYTVRLEVGNADANCFAVDSILIRIRCPAVATIPSSGGSGSTVNFTGNATGSTDFEWFLNGVPTGNTTTSYTYTHTNVGTQIIQFVVRHSSGCSDTATRIITNNCPVRPVITSLPSSMETANQATTLNITGSSNVSAATWTLNGVQISTNLSTTFTVPSRGSFQLCLTGANTYCQAQVCQVVYVLPDSNACGSTYLKSFGNNAGGWDILAARNGGYYISGYKADSSLILHTNANGNIIWQKTLKFTNATSEQIHNLAEDSNGDLVGLGYGGTAAPYNVFVFKYSPSTHTILWANSYTSNEKLFSDIFESATGGNYLVVGQTQGTIFGTSDGIYTEFNRNTGIIFSTRRHNLGDQDALARNTSQSNFIFSIGSHTNGTGAGNMRATITKTNRLGSFPNNVLWSKSYIYNNAANTQRKGADLILDGNNLIGLEYGDNNGTNLSNATTSLFKTDTSGNLIWSKQYNIANATNQTPLRVLNLPNGYVIVGHCDLAGTQQAFLIGTNKSGGFQWAKAYGSGSLSLFRDAVARDKDIFAVGSTNSNSILLTKLDSAGGLNTTLTCASIQSLTVNETSLPNVQTNFTATVSNMSLSVLGLSLNSQNTVLSAQTACASPCVLYEICDNGVDDDFDNLIDCSDTTECQCNPCSAGSGNIWFFGNRAGIDFKTDPPTILTGSTMNTQEGSAVYNDLNGKMLFYTDGTNVWDRTHTIMTNGTGLMGHPSSAQSALIVPHPGDINLFYIFTTPAQVGAGSTNNGMRYSILDIRLRNGYGDITATKNIPLLLNATERLTGVKHCNGRDYWVVTTEFNTNNFHIYLVDNNGLNPVPTIQPLGQATTTASLNQNEDCIGILKFSSDTRRLAQSFRTAKGISLYDFDNSTGIISNPKFITNTQWVDPYGVEFSPNNDLLYFISSMRGVIQLDATATSAAALSASVITVSTNGAAIGYSGLQRAPNGKIYMKGGGAGSHLGVINNPDIRGIGCNYQDNAIALSPGGINLGFCNFMADVYKSIIPPKIIGEDSVCAPFSTPKTYRIFAHKPCNVDTIIWTLRGQSSLLSQTDSNAVVQPLGVGFDTLIVSFFGACANTQDTMIIQKFAATTLSLPNDTILCENAPVALAANVQNVVLFRWQNGSTDAVYTADQAGWHKAQAVGACGQILRDSVLVTYNPLLIPHISDTTVCTGDTLRIQLANNFNYNWSPNVGISCVTCSNPAFYPTVATTYIGVTFNPTTGCTAVDTFTVSPVLCSADTIRIDSTICPYQTYTFRGQTYAPNSSDTIRIFTAVGALDSIFYIQVRSNPLPNNTDFQNTVVVGQVLCNGTNTGSLSFNWSAGAQPYTYLWSNGRSSSNITGLSSGLYTITVSDARHCTATFSTSISQPAPLTLALTNTSSACSGILSANASPSGGLPAYAYLWSNGNTNANITVVSAGLYSLTTTDANLCSISTNVSISTPAGIVLSINNTPNLCLGNSNLSVTTQNALQPLAYIWSNGSTNNSLSGISNGTYFLTLSDANGCTATAQTTASAPAILQMSLNETSLSCVVGASAAASVSNGTAPYAYLWSNAGTNNPINNLSGNPSLTVTDANGCTVAGNLTLNPNRPQGVSFNILSATLGCGVALSANIQTGTSPLSYLWSTGASSQTLNNPAAGVYSLSISDASGCAANQSATVRLTGAPNLSAYIGQANTQDTSIFLGETIQIGAGSNQSGLAYVWSELNNPSQAGISTPNLANNAVNPNQNGNYIFVISATVSGQNCSATDTVRLLVKAYEAIQLPTAFSPNNDGENDFYRPIGLDIQHIQAFRIHNRWGQILYDSPQLSGGGWDGTFNGSPQARDVYISTLIYKRPQDAQATERRIEFTLLR